MTPAKTVLTLQTSYSAEYSSWRPLRTT